MRKNAISIIFFFLRIEKTFKFKQLFLCFMLFSGQVGLCQSIQEMLSVLGEIGKMLCILNSVESSQHFIIIYLGRVWLRPGGSWRTLVSIPSYIARVYNFNWLNFSCDNMPWYCSKWIHAVVNCMQVSDNDFDNKE